MSYWFRPKYYGYGATPSNWKGWLATLVFLLTAMGIAASPMERPLALVLLLAATAYFIWIARKKSDGAWRWRWGSSAKRNGT